jgi:hypothetical protein
VFTDDVVDGEHDINVAVLDDDGDVVRDGTYLINISSLGANAHRGEHFSWSVLTVNGIGTLGISVSSLDGRHFLRATDWGVASASIGRRNEGSLLTGIS